jgi:hypothetical protein
VITLCLPAFSQNNTGGSGIILPSFDSIPDDGYSSTSSSPDIPNAPATPTPSEPQNRVKDYLARELKKKIEFMKINHLVKKLLRDSKNNIKSVCHEENPKIIGLKSFLVYLEKKEISETLKLASINSKAECKKSAFSCVFQGENLKTFSSLIHHPNFKEYLMERKEWKEKNANEVSAYLESIETKLKK